MKTFEPLVLNDGWSPNFRGLNPDEFKGNKLTVDVALEYVGYLNSLTKYLATTGRELMEKEVLTYAEWFQLLDATLHFWRDLWQQKLAVKLLVVTMEKGVESLARLVEGRDLSGKCTNDDIEWQWYRAIMYQLRPGFRLGVGSHGCDTKTSRRLLSRLVPIVQCFKDDGELVNLAKHSFPEDSKSSEREAFVLNNKNW